MPTRQNDPTIAMKPPTSINTIALSDCPHDCCSVHVNVQSSQSLLQTPAPGEIFDEKTHKVQRKAAKYLHKNSQPIRRPTGAVKLSSFQLAITRPQTNPHWHA